MGLEVIKLKRTTFLKFFLIYFIFTKQEKTLTSVVLNPLQVHFHFLHDKKQKKCQPTHLQYLLFSLTKLIH